MLAAAMSQGEPVMRPALAAIKGAAAGQSGQSGRGAARQLRAERAKVYRGNGGLVLPFSCFLLLFY